MEEEFDVEVFELVRRDDGEVDHEDDEIDDRGDGHADGGIGARFAGGQSHGLGSS